MSVETMPIERIIPSAFNPRVNEEANEVLGASIEAQGIQEPLELYPLDEAGEKLGIVDGHCRYRWAMKLGLKEVPFTIRKDLTTEAEVLEYILLKALTREGLTPLEEAQAYQSLLDATKISQSTLAKRLGKSQPVIANALRILKAPKDLQELLICRQITSKHVIKVLPYVPYKRLYKQILIGLRDDLKHGSVSVKSLQRHIDEAIMERWGEMVCLEIKAVGTIFPEYAPFVNFSGCKKCEHLKKVEHWSGGHYCLKYSCWKGKINKGKRAAEKKQQAALQGKKKRAKVKTSALACDQYENFTYSNGFSREECLGCDHYKKNEHDTQLCLDPKCFRKKKAAYSRQNNAAEREGRAQIMAAMDVYFQKRKTPNWRWAVVRLAETLELNTCKKALSKWGQAKTRDDLEGIAKIIPEDELFDALELMLAMGDLELAYYRVGKQHWTKEVLKEAFPAALPYYQGGESLD